MGRTGVVLALMHQLKIFAPTVGATLLVWGLLLAYTSSPAHAATITVNSLADDADGTDGECTLREAITSANTDASSGTATGECAKGSGDDVIEVGVTGTVNLTRVLPVLSTNIQIEGPGADQLTVRRNTGGNYVIFRVGLGADVSLSGMTISNGRTGLTDLGGGGIYNGGGTLTVTDSTVSDNAAPDTSGGGIYNDRGFLTVTDSTVSDSSADLGGGIMSSGGTLTVTDSTISGNSVPHGTGGGIFSNRTALMTIVDSTISDNSADFSGGGIFIDGGAIGTTITRSTISANSADQGGGVYTNTDLLDGNDTIITNSTISGNTATTNGGGLYNNIGLTIIEFSTITNNTAPNGKGSGVSSQGSDSARTDVLSSIISANTNTDVDFFNNTTNTFASKGYNLIGDGNATGAFNQTGDQTGVRDPKLDPLGSYGGSTPTHRLQSESPAVDAGPPTDGDPIACPPPPTDQRGVARPQGKSCDSGAFELVQQPPKPTTREECKKGGYKEFGFKNQGRCIAFVNRSARDQ